MVHEVVYEVYWFAIGAWTVGNCLLLHMCALALMFLPVLYFSRDGRFRQVLFELLFFFGLGGAMQALFTPDIGMHGFPEFKYFNYFLSHGTIVLGLVYAAVVYPGSSSRGNRGSGSWSGRSGCPWRCTG